MPATNALWAPVQAPPVTPARGGLLAVAKVQQANAGDVVHGFTFPMTACAPATLLAQDCWTQFGDVAETPKVSEGFDWTRTITFGIYAGVECFAYGGDDYDDVARQRLELGQGYAIANAFESEILRAPSTTVVPGGTDIADAIAVAEQYAGSVYSGLPVIHMDRAAATCAAAMHLAVPGLDWTLTTQQGTPIANDAAYGPAQTTGCPGFVWVTGQVDIWLGPIVVTRVIDAEYNRTMALAERHVAIAAECFVASVGTVPAPTTGGGGQPNPQNPGGLELEIGTTPSSPVVEGTDITIRVNTSTAPTGEVELFRRTPSGSFTSLGEMTQVSSDEFVFNYQTDDEGGMQLRFRAVADGQVSQTIVVDIEEAP